MRHYTDTQRMRNEVKVLVSLLVFYQAVALRSTLDASDNVFCAPFSSIVTVDPGRHSFFPYFVKLFRCQGSDGQNKPSVKKCVVKKYTVVNVTVTSLTTEASHNSGSLVRSLKNHTSCHAECVKGPSDCHPTFEYFNDCVCKCKYKDKVYNRCKPGYRWNSYQCRCECSKPPSLCQAKQIWSKEQCSCVSSLTREIIGVHQNEDKTVIFVTFLVLEGVVIVVLFLLLIHWIRKKKTNSDKFSGADKETFTEPLRHVDSKTKLIK